VAQTGPHRGPPLWAMPCLLVGGHRPHQYCLGGRNPTYRTANRRSLEIDLRSFASRCRRIQQLGIRDGADDLAGCVDGEVMVNKTRRRPWQIGAWAVSSSWDLRS